MWKQVLAVGTMLFLSLPGWCAGGRSYAGWQIADSFNDGIPSWQSYPLAQDIGYDPSVYTTKLGERMVLRRDVINEGQAAEEVGLIRPISFHLTGSSQIAFSYSLEPGGELANARMILAARDGAKYEVPLPLTSHADHAMVVEGSQFKVAGGQADIEAVAILYSVRHAPLGAHSYLTLYSFSIKATRPAALTMLSPHIEESSTGHVPVADGFVVTGEPIQFAFSAAPTRVVVKNGEGVQEHADIAIEGNHVRWTPAKTAAPGLWTVEVANDHASIRFRVLVLTEEAPHEGILLSAERLEQLRTEDRYSGVRQAIHREAMHQAQELSFNKSAGNSIALLPSQSVLAGLQSYAHLLGSYGSAVANNALDYRLNGNQEGLENARKALATVSAWKTWTPPWFTTHGMQTYYQVGTFTEQLALGYDLVADQLSSSERKEIEGAMFRNVIQPTVDDYYLKDRMPTAASNHMSNSVGGALAAWIALDHADPQWRVAHATSLSELIVAYEDMLRGLFPGDGSEAEPGGYEIFAMEGMTYGISSLNSLGIQPAGAENMMESFWWLRYAEVKPQLLLDTGDTRSDIASLYGYAWIAEHSTDPGARWLYDTVADSSGAAQKQRSLNRERTPSVLDLLCCTKQAEEFTLPPPSRIFAGRGSIALREGWNEDQTVVSIRIGPWFNHEHHDQGAFQLADQGELLVGEGGHANYYSDPNYKDYFSEAPAHNVVLLDHDAFSQIPYDGRYWKALSAHPRITSSLLGKRIDYIETDLQPAYGKALRSYTRRFLYLKPGMLIVNDELDAPEPHIFTWPLHAAPGAIVEQHGSTATIEGAMHRGEVTVIASNPASQWKVSQGPVATDNFTDLDKKPVDERLVLSLDSPTTSKQDFLVGLSAGKADQQAAIEKVTTKSGEGFSQSDATEQSVALLRTHDGLLETAGTSTDGDALAVVKSTASGDTHVFAAHMRSLRIAGGSSLSLTTPGNLAWDQAQEVVTLSLELENSSTLGLSAKIVEGSMKLDGKSDTGFAPSGSIVLSRGKHQISFRLASSPQ